MATMALVTFGYSYWMTRKTEPKPTRAKTSTATIFRQMFVQVDGLRIRYIDEGVGKVIVLLPGLTSRIEEYDEMILELQKQFRVIVLDLPGSGYSEKPDQEYTLAFYEKTVLHFLDTLGIK